MFRGGLCLLEIENDCVVPYLLLYVPHLWKTRFSAKCTAQGGTKGDEFLRGAAFGPNSTAVLVGRTNESWGSPNAGGDDMVVVKLDIDGNLLWTWQVRIS